MRKLARAAATFAVLLALCSCAATGDQTGAGHVEGDNTATEEAIATNDVVLPPSDDPEFLALQNDSAEPNATPLEKQSLQEAAEEQVQVTPNKDSGAWASETVPALPAKAFDGKEEGSGSQNADEDETGLGSGYLPTFDKVIGSDDRITVRDTFSYPFSAIAYLFFHRSCGCEGSGTGFMVGSNILLTASHCICCTEHHQPADYIVAYFGYQPDGSYAYRYDGATTYTYGTSFPDGYTSDSMNWDYAVVRLDDENVGDYTGWFGLSVKPDNDFNGRPYTVAGYRDDLLKYDTNTTEVFNDHTIKHYIDGVAGNSGAPIFTWDNYASAIHIAENKDHEWNVGLRITQNVVDTVLELQGKKPEGGDNKRRQPSWSIPTRRAATVTYSPTPTHTTTRGASSTCSPRTTSTSPATRFPHATGTSLSRATSSAISARRAGIAVR